MESQRIVLPPPQCDAQPVTARRERMMSAAFARRPVI
jgi:hypothetical protein